ncbi:MAG: tripartite tricarboxylate transporter permease [Pseudomonadota bacterium]
MALLVISIFAVPLFVQMIKVPYRVLGPSVVVVCALGTFSVHASFVETYLMFAAGIVGFFMRLYGFSPAALVLALVLGPLAEEALRQTMTISRGSFSVFFERTPSLWIIGVTIALLVKLPLLNRFGSTSAGEAEKAGS